MSIQQSSESDLPECTARQVCNRVDIYATPWVERHCRCPGPQKLCPQSLDAEDGHSVIDRTRLFKTCEPLSALPTCRFFRDITWTIEQRELSGGNGDTSTIGRQIINCICPSNSVAYIARHEAIQTPEGTIKGFKYSFACSPLSVSSFLSS